MHVLKLSQIWAKYTAVSLALQMLLPAWALADELKLPYRGHEVELSVENKVQLAGLLAKLEGQPSLKLHLATTSPQSAIDHALGQERLAWVQAFFKERNLDVSTRVKSTTYLYSPSNNPLVIISW